MERENKKNDLCGCYCLKFSTAPANRPPAIDANFWAQATATGEVCGEGCEGYIEVSAKGLIPLGVYTLWFMTDKGPFPAAPLNANYGSDGYDPNRLVVNSNGVLNYYVAPLDYNPFKGIPILGGCAKVQGVSIAFNSDRTTHGLSPGTPNVTFFEQLIAQFGIRNEGSK